MSAQHSRATHHFDIRELPTGNSMTSPNGATYSDAFGRWMIATTAPSLLGARHSRATRDLPEQVNVPVWAGVTAIVIGAGFLLVPNSKS